MLLITPAEVIQMAFTDREIITPSSIRSLKIDVAQEHFIRPRLGDDMFEELTQGLHPEFTEDYIKPALSQFIRYGVIAELAIRVSDNGALVYSSSNGSIDKQANKTTSVTKNQNQEIDQKQTVADDWEGQKQLTVEGTEIDQVNHTFTKPLTQEADEDIKKGQTSNELFERHFQDRHQTKTVMDELSKVETQTDQQTAADEQNDKSTNEQFRAATMIEIRALTTRALGDGHILLAKAVRHVERHLELYPAYVPSRFFTKIFY